MISRNSRPVFVVNAENSGVDPKDYAKFEPVYVVNSGSSGTTVDTYTKDELDAKLQSILEGVDALAKATQASKSYLSPETNGWIEQNVYLTKKKIERCEQIHQEIGKMMKEFVDDYDDFKSYIMELLNIRPTEEEMEQPQPKEQKIEDVEIVEEELRVSGEIPVITQE